MENLGLVLPQALVRGYHSPVFMRRPVTKGTARWLFKCGPESLHQNKARVNHPVLNQALLISMHLQADVCGALIGSFLAFFLNLAMHFNSISNQTSFLVLAVLSYFDLVTVTTHQLPFC